MAIPRGALRLSSPSPSAPTPAARQKGEIFTTALSADGAAVANARGRGKLRRACCNTRDAGRTAAAVEKGAARANGVHDAGAPRNERAKSEVNIPAML
jgi:hypothetical protein